MTNAAAPARTAARVKADISKVAGLFQHHTGTSTYETRHNACIRKAIATLTAELDELETATR